MRSPRLRLRTALFIVAVLAFLMWCGTARFRRCPNCGARASLTELFWRGGCPLCGLTH
jgi:hypothetical protein